MKKIVLGLMAIVALFTVAGCEKKNSEIPDSSKADYTMSLAEDGIIVDYTNISKWDDTVDALYRAAGNKIVALSPQHDPVNILEFKNNGNKCEYLYVEMVDSDIDDDNVYINYQCDNTNHVTSGLVSVDKTTHKLDVLKEYSGNRSYQYYGKKYIYYYDNHNRYFYKTDTKETIEFNEIHEGIPMCIADDIVYMYNYAPGFYYYAKSNLDGKNYAEVSKTEFYGACDAGVIIANYFNKVVFDLISKKYDIGATVVYLK